MSNPSDAAKTETFWMWYQVGDGGGSFAPWVWGLSRKTCQQRRDEEYPDRPDLLRPGRPVRVTISPAQKPRRTRGKGGRRR